MVVRRVMWQQFNDLRQNVHAGEVDRQDIEHAPHGNRQVLFADIGFVNDELDEARAFLLLLFEQFLHLGRAQQAVLDQGVGDAFSE